MKFTGPLSTLLVVLPFLALQVNAAPSLVARGRGGGKGKGGGNAKSTSAAGAAASSTSADAAASSTDSGAAASSTDAGAASASSTASGAAATSSGAAAGGGDGGLTLNPSVIGPNLANNGQGNGSEAGQVASLTSTNNFINFCVGKTNTNGQQVQAGSCNSVPMGDIPAKANQPSCKFTSPQNGGKAAEANAPFTISMAVQGFETGNFVNPNSNYFGAPQQLNGQGQIIGHSHVVVEKLNSLTDTTPLDPTKFSFFQGLNAPAANGVLTVNVAKGLPEGAYKVSSINTAANHQPVLGPVAQHGSFDDVAYFTIGGAAGFGGAGAGAGAAAGAANGTANAGAASSSAAGAASTSATDAGASASSTASAAANTASAAAGKGGKGGKGGKKGGKKARRFLLAREN